MTRAICVACALPVLELEGQFEVLDSYNLNESPIDPGSAGWWHSRCLTTSAVGSQWHELRLQNFVNERGYRRVGDLPSWVVVQHPRTGEIVAFARDGRLVDLTGKNTSTATAVTGGSIYSVRERDFHLKLPHVAANERTISAVQAALATSGTYPILELANDLGIRDRLFHAEALQGGVLQFDPELRPFWGRHAVAFRAEYGVFIPAELEAYMVSAPRTPGEDGAAELPPSQSASAASPQQRVSVVEFHLHDGERDKVVARFVLNPDGAVVTVAPTEHYRNVSDETVENGVPGPGGRYVKRDAGLTFLQLLAPNFRGSRFWASKVFEMDEADAMTPPPYDSPPKPPFE
jgi:hypothetical protein